MARFGVFARTPGVSSPLGACTSRDAWLGWRARAGSASRIDRAFGRRHPCLRGRRRDSDESGSWIDDEIIEIYTAPTSMESHTRLRRGGTIGWSAGCTVSRCGRVFRGIDVPPRNRRVQVALVALIDRLRARGYRLLDTQWVTPASEQFARWRFEG